MSRSSARVKVSTSPSASESLELVVRGRGGRSVAEDPEELEGEVGMRGGIGEDRGGVGALCSSTAVGGGGRGGVRAATPSSGTTDSSVWTHRNPSKQPNGFKQAEANTYHQTYLSNQTE